MTRIFSPICLSDFEHEINTCTNLEWMEKYYSLQAKTKGKNRLLSFF
jgi:hypothetical protein